MVKKVLASHILVKSEAEAGEIRYDVTHGKDFAEVAKARSTCPSGKKGGSLGWFGKGQMVKEFDKAVFALKKGEISRPVKTQFGWHLIRLDDTR